MGFLCLLKTIKDIDANESDVGHYLHPMYHFDEEVQLTPLDFQPSPFASAPEGHVFIQGKRWCEFHFFDSATLLERWLAANHFDEAFAYGWFDDCGMMIQVCVRKVLRNGRTHYVSAEPVAAAAAWNS